MNTKVKVRDKETGEMSKVFLVEYVDRAHTPRVVLVAATEEAAYEWLKTQNYDMQTNSSVEEVEVYGSED